MITDTDIDDDIGQSMAALYIGDNGFKKERGFKLERSCNIGASSERLYLPSNDFEDFPFIDY